MTAPDMTPRVGDRLGDGRFELLAKLGEGGMSVVFRARDHARQRDVALKLLQPRYVGRPDREQRLVNEVDYLRRLQGQPRIVELVDAGRFAELGGWPWLATKVLEGRTLNWLFLDTKLEWEVVWTIIRQIAESLEACHRCGIVNRDVTPTNVMVVDPSAHAIELFDFSHAGSVDAPRVAAGTLGRLTGEFDAPGSAGYMSPEQARKAPPDPSMDVFGFGALIYELVTHETPYADVGDRDAFIRAQSQGRLEPLRLHAWAYGVPRDLGALVQACTQRSPAQRPTMPEVVRRLERLGEAATPAAPVGPEAKPAATARTRPLLGVVLAAAIVVVIALVAGVRRSTSDADLVADTPAHAGAGDAVDPERPLREAVPPEAQDVARADPGTSASPNADRRPPEPRPRSRSEGGEAEPARDVACDNVVATAKAAAAARDWDTALRLARRAECWPSRRERLRVEVSAYASLGRWADCVRVGRSSNDPEIEALVATCERSR